MAFTIGRYGVATLLVARQADGGGVPDMSALRDHRPGRHRRPCGFSLWKFIRYIKEEILLVLGTSSSESALPRMMSKLEYLGCSQVGRGPGDPDRLLVQSRWHVDLHDDRGRLRCAGAGHASRAVEYLMLLGVLMLTSKGAAAVTGGGFITLAATLASTSTLPVAGLTLLIGVDRFMSEARAITNLIGTAWRRWSSRDGRGSSICRGPCGFWIAGRGPARSRSSPEPAAS